MIKVKAIQSLVPNAEINIRDDVIEWINPSIAPVTDEQIENKIKELQELESTKEEEKSKTRELALAKLTALGLTEAEVKALIG